MKNKIFERICSQIPSEIGRNGIQLSCPLFTEEALKYDTPMEQLLEKKYQESYIYNINYGTLGFDFLCGYTKYPVKVEFYKDNKYAVWHMYVTCSELNINKKVATRKCLPYYSINELYHPNESEHNVCCKIDFHPRYVNWKYIRSKDPSKARTKRQKIRYICQEIPEILKKDEICFYSKQEQKPGQYSVDTGFHKFSVKFNDGDYEIALKFSKDKSNNLWDIFLNCSELDIINVKAIRKILPNGTIPILPGINLCIINFKERYVK